MLSLITFVVTSVLATFVVAQAPTTNFTSQQLTTIIGEVDATTRSAWCNGQRRVCGSLCGGQNDVNTCDQNSLSYNCTCTSNHSAPALQYYDNSMIAFICNQGNGDCMKTNAGDLAGQQQCNVTWVCGSANASRVAVATTSSAMPSSTATGSATGTTSPTASTTAKGAAIKLGQDYGVGLLVVAMGAVMGLAL